MYPRPHNSDWKAISHVDYSLAAANWQKMTGCPSLLDITLSDFVSFNLNDAEWLGSDASTRMVVVPPHVLPKLKMLASPHHVALYRAWQIVNAPDVYDGEASVTGPEKTFHTAQP